MQNFSVRYGRARSGTLINELFVKNLKQNSFEDIFDAYGLFSYLAIREKRKRGETEQLDHFESSANRCHRYLLKRSDLNALISKANLKSAFDLYGFGRSLAFVEFRDP